MHAAFNTLQSELERLVLLKESIEQSGQAANEQLRISELELKITSHHKALKVILRHHFAEHKLMQQALQDRQGIQ